MDLKWIFDGIGTELLSLCAGSIIGGAVGYKIGAKGTSKQKAGTNAEQSQELEIDLEAEKSGARATISQEQKAKDGASQSQVGRIKIDNE